MSKKEVIDSAQIKKYRFWPVPEAIFIGLLFFGAIFITTFFIYQHALNAQIGEIKEGLLRTAKVLESFIDADTHSSFIHNDQKNSKEYLRAVMPLKRAIESDSTIPFAYTTIFKDGKVFFILDPVPASSEEAVAIMEEYEEPSQELLKTLKEQVISISEEPYTDEWGSFVSAHIPIFDSNKKFVGALSVDIDATAYFKRLEPIKRATIRAVVIGLFISYMVAALVWFMRNFSKKLSDKRIDLVNILEKSTSPKDVS